MKILFICNQNLNRSKTAEEIFRDNKNRTIPLPKGRGIYRSVFGIENPQKCFAFFGHQKPMVFECSDLKVGILDPIENSDKRVGIFNKYETKSAGLYNDKPVIKSEISWADLIIVMEKDHRTELSKRFPKE
ncbi:MAG: hypothetical protein V1740_03660 [Candidatus Woesearchaeota archaeon]